MNDPVAEALRKMNAYEVNEPGVHLFVLGKFVWAYSKVGKNWIIKTVKHSPSLHFYLVTLRDSAYESDHRAGLQADAWARFLKGGHYTRHYASKAS